jgi:SAM-dependent methyltransferase
MPHPPSPAALSSPAAVRNRDAILAVLEPVLPDRGLVLEIAAGSGEHAVHFAGACPGLVWQPADLDDDALASIAAWRDFAGLANLRPPLQLNAADPESWPIRQADVIVAINMIHIAPWSAAQGLMAGAHRLLPNGGVLFLYGPYFETGVIAAPSNLAFDLSLKSRNSAWGLRHLDTVDALAAQNGLVLSGRIAMPANNLALVFRKADPQDPAALR